MQMIKILTGLTAGNPISLQIPEFSVDSYVTIRNKTWSDKIQVSQDVCVREPQLDGSFDGEFNRLNLKLLKGLQETFKIQDTSLEFKISTTEQFNYESNGIHCFSVYIYKDNDNKVQTSFVVDIESVDTDKIDFILTNKSAIVGATANGLVSGAKDLLQDSFPNHASKVATEYYLPESYIFQAKAGRGFVVGGFSNQGISYELELVNLKAEKYTGLSAGTISLTPVHLVKDVDSIVSIRARSIGEDGEPGEWSERLKFTQLSGNFAGYVENLTTYESKRINTKTEEDNQWISIAKPRMNEYTNDDAVTKFFDQKTMPHGHMKRVVLDRSGNEIEDFTELSLDTPKSKELMAATDRQIMVKIPTHEIVDVEFMHTGTRYMLKLIGMSKFNVSMAKLGFAGYTNLEGRYSKENKGVISSTQVPGFYYGVDNAVTIQVGNQYYTGSFLRNQYPQVNWSRASFRQYIQNFGPNWKIKNLDEKTAIANLYYTERGYTGNGIAGFGEHHARSNSKWAERIYDAVNMGRGDYQITENAYQALSLGLKTGTKKRSNGTIVANNFRGICNYTGNIWEFIDGISVFGQTLWIAKDHFTTYNDSTNFATSGYAKQVKLMSSVSVGDSHGWIKSFHPGTMIPKEYGASITTGMQGYIWFTGRGGHYVLFDNPAWSCSAHLGSVASWYSWVTLAFSGGDIGSRCAFRNK